MATEVEMTEAETWQTASAGAVVNGATADAALRFWAFFHAMLDGQPEDTCPVPPVGDLMRLIHSRIVGLVLLLPGSSIEGHAHKSISWGHTNIARIPSTAACRQLLAEPQPRIGGMVDQRLDLCLPGRGYVRASQTAGTNRTSPVCGPHGSLCVGTHQPHLPRANLGTACYDFRPESDDDGRPGRGVVLRLGGHGALIAGPGRAAVMCKLFIRIPSSAGQLTCSMRLLSDMREFAADRLRTLGMRGLRIARLAASSSTTDSTAVGEIDTVVVTGDTAHRDYLLDATSSSGGGDDSMSMSASSTRTGSAVVLLPPGDYEIRFEMLYHSRAHSHGDSTKAAREAVCSSVFQSNQPIQNDPFECLS
jgi:hypothetical protein